MNRQATIVNGTSGMLYEGRDVPFSRQNEVGFSRRTNQLSETEDFTTAAWIKSNSTTPSANEIRINSGRAITISSVGLFTGAAAAGQLRSATAVTLPNQLCVASLSFKAGNTFTHCQLRISPDTNLVTLTAGSIVRLSDGFSDSPDTIVIDEGDGWYRVIRTFTPAAGNYYLGIWFWNQTSIASTTGNESVLIRNAQLSVGDHPYQRIGADPGNDVLFPALLTEQKSAATDPLEYIGPAPMNAQLEDANCFSFDGVDDRIAIDLDSIAGLELITNGTFDSDLSGWTSLNDAIVTWSDGKMSFTRVSNAADRVNTIFPAVSGREYLITIGDVSNSFGNLRIGTTPGAFNILGTTNIEGNGFKIIFTSTQSSDLHFSLGRSTNGTTLFDNISIRELPSITNDGTSEITYRTQGDGITGTAGTAFNVHLGEAAHLACTEGGGSQIHDTINNVAYDIVNGQASNWTTLQNDYHPNTVDGWSDPLKLLGPELVTNGTFDTDLDGWTAVNYTWDNGRATIIDDMSFSLINNTTSALLDLNPDKYYIISTHTNRSSINRLALGTHLSVGNVLPRTVVNMGDYYIHYGIAKPVDPYTRVSVQLSSPVTGDWVDNISVRELPSHPDALIPASKTNPGFDCLDNPLTNPPVKGLNNAESTVNFSPVANSWSDKYSIPGADLPNYEFDGNPGDIEIGVQEANHEGRFRLRKQ